MTLTEFLRARIAEDEDLAKRAAFGWGAEWSSEDDDDNEWCAVHADGKRNMVGCEDRDVTGHIARHDPARVLAECAAKRQTLELISSPGPQALRLLASVYADHPDYRDEWKP